MSNKKLTGILVPKNNKKAKMFATFYSDKPIDGSGGGTSDYSDLSNKPSIEGVTLNGNKTASDLGLAKSSNLATVATTGSYNDLDDKPTIPTVPTNVSAFTNDAGYLTQHQDISGKADKVLVATTEPSGGMLPNVLYEFGELSGNTTFTLATPTDNTIANHYYFTFDTPSTAPTITWPTGLTWFGGSAPTISASKHYEISVLNGIAIAMEV